MTEIPKHIPEERINKRKIKETVKNSTPEALKDVPRNGAGFDVTPVGHLISLSTFNDLCGTPFMDHYIINPEDITTLTTMSSLARRRSNAETKETENIRDVAISVGISRVIIYNWRKRYLQYGVLGLQQKKKNIPILKELRKPTK